MSIASGATLDFNRSDEVSVAPPMSSRATAASFNSGPSTLSISAGNAYTGGTVVNDGMIVAGSNTAFGSGGITLSGGGLTLAPGVSIANQIVLDVVAAAGTSLGAVLPVEYLVVAGGGGGGDATTAVVVAPAAC